MTKQCRCIHSPNERAKSTVSPTNASRWMRADVGTGEEAGIVSGMVSKRHPTAIAGYAQ